MMIVGLWHRHPAYDGRLRGSMIGLECVRVAFNVPITIDELQIVRDAVLEGATDRAREILLEWLSADATASLIALLDGNREAMTLISDDGLPCGYLLSIAYTFYGKDDRWT